MYNQKSAKDQLAQYPRRLAEGGEVETRPDEAIGTSVFDWKAPVVEARKPRLTPVDQLPGSMPGANPEQLYAPSLSDSQIFARDRAAKQQALNTALAQSGAPVSTLERNAMLQRLYSGDLDVNTLQEQVVDPLYEQRVRNAYKAVGLTGDVSEDNAPGTIRQEDFNSWMNRLRTGEVTGQDFQTSFLTDLANYSGPDAANQRTYINNARKILGLPEITDPVPASANNSLRFGEYGPTARFAPNQSAATMQSPLLATMGLNLPPVPKPAATTPQGVSPVNFGASPTQLFAKGGEVNKFIAKNSK